MSRKPISPMAKSDDPEQSRRFIEMALEREADGDAKDLGRALKKLAPHKRDKTKASPKRPR